MSERYRIERELGAGGMATVYLAHDDSGEADGFLVLAMPYVEGESALRRRPGLTEEAEELYRAALRQADELPHRIEGAEVRRWYARTLLEHGADDQARALLGEARLAYERIGMPRHVAMVDERLKDAS